MSGQGGAVARVRAFVSDPVHLADGLQGAKAVLAAVLAWLIALDLAGHQQAFLAPWSAVLTVHATVYRTVTRGVQQVAASVTGVLVAFGVGSVLGVDAATLAVALALCYVIGSLRWFREEGVTITTTALIVLTTGYSTSTGALAERLIDTGIGIAVGCVVNLLVVPPLNDRAAAREVDRIDDTVGRLLCDISDGLRGECTDEDVEGWVSRSRDLDADIEHAWRAVDQARESGRFNLRLNLHRQKTTDSVGYGDVLERLEQATADVRSMVRTLGDSFTESWDEEFRDRWVALLHSAGDAVLAANDEALHQVRADLNSLYADLSRSDVARLRWPVYGGLLVNLRNIVEVLAHVAAVNPIRPASPHRLP